LLADVPGDMLAAARSAGPSVGRRPPGRARGRSGRPWQGIAAAACLAAVAGAAGGFWLAPRDGAAQPAALTLSGSNPAVHMTATAALTATSWGTSIQLRLTGAPLNVPCRLIVRSRTGVSEVAGGLGCLGPGSDQRPGQCCLAAIRHRQPPDRDRGRGAGHDQRQHGQEIAGGGRHTRNLKMP
jgi:hypothetical protein